jgi:hypothetical protein
MNQNNYQEDLRNFRIQGENIGEEKLKDGA